MQKAYVESIVIEHILDEDPDISFLQQDYLEDSITPEDRTKYLEQDKQRLAQYERGYFCFMGIKAKANIIIPYNNYGLCQTVHSGGLWGIESDSDKDYIASIEKDELNNLKDVCKRLNIRIPKNVKIETEESV